LAQTLIETDHADIDSMTVFLIITDKEKKRQELFMIGGNNEAIRKREKCMKDFICGDHEQLEGLAALAALERILFSGAFSVIFWIETYNTLQNLIFSNV
jgi:ribonucleotide reductase beta subunit family protein with ferritin-like domain